MSTNTTVREAALPQPGAEATVISRALPWLLALGGAVGLLASTALLVEKVRVLADPEHVPACSINPVLSCGTVMATPQAGVFGIPNPVIGVACFAVVTTVGVALLAGARFDRWFWLGLQAGVLFGVVFVHWLIFQSLYRIGALCPYCMVVWAVTIPLFWYVTLHNVRSACLPVPSVLCRPVDLLARNHTVVLTVWALAIIGLVGQAFWTYWATFL
ncbi:vitamin K epoxide reductase family protein [Nocardiopsis alborubida]|uniref:Vitamin K epoxide reductase family protein n=1 Tax=Nocardiopsis alborubida TaxID=146802 RepID=A0A7X6RNL1_9ACTN|nr:vitamin K epoxide reductase family protein [Nocardiopsis alborubida]NKY96653.1 vitamin K epoxide reductase family protein [Nocardiopsis alborubida]